MTLFLLCHTSLKFMILIIPSIIPSVVLASIVSFFLTKNIVLLLAMLKKKKIIEVLSFIKIVKIADFTQINLYHISATHSLRLHANI